MGVATGRAHPATTDRPTAAAAIAAHGLRKSYRGKLAVDSLDLEVARGTVLGLLGPNGAGKTTLIRMLSTILPPDAGTITVAGVEHTRPDELRRRVGVLPESAGYPGNQTCEEWLVLHARLFGVPRREAHETARRSLEDVGLTPRRSSLISGLSRGMRQKLGIARALLNAPQVVFLDEPTLGLDPVGQRQVMGLVTGIVAERGVTVVLSTHVLDEVEQICHRVVIMNRGRIVADGTVAEVVRRAAEERQVVVDVPSALQDRAADVLRAGGVTVTSVGSYGRLELHLPAAQELGDAASATLRALLAADIPVLGFSMEGARLSDAFLAVTEGAEP